jgi:hypothetical protein
MPKTLKYAPIFFLLVFFCFSTASHADQMFQVSGTLISIGNSVPSCPPTACAEILDFSFLASPLVSGSQVDLVASDFSLSESGPLTLSPTGGSGPLGDNGYYYFGGGGDEIDLSYALSPVSGGYDLGLLGAFFYACTSATCVQDFTTEGIGCVGGLCPDFYPVKLVDVAIN